MSSDSVAAMVPLLSVRPLTAGVIFSSVDSIGPPTVTKPEISRTLLSNVGVIVPVGKPTEPVIVAIILSSVDARVPSIS
jgi:hypothetical protein